MNDKIGLQAVVVHAVWTYGDAAAVLEGAGVKPTDRNLEKFIASARSSISAAAVQAGNESMEAALADMLARGELDQD